MYDGTFDEMKVDISVNPGRRSKAPGMWLWAAVKMWFGPGTYGLIDRNRPATLPVGKVECRNDGVTVVDLYDLSDDIEEIRERPRRAPELVAHLDDPCVNIEVGEFPNGGIRWVTEWMDDGRLVPRSRATVRRVAELDAAGAIIVMDEQRVEPEP